jgi:YegS/Rv2252/BmrU family lipid kinase
MQEGTLEGTTADIEQKTTAILIANPTSGSYTQHAHRIEETISFLRKRGWQADLRLTQVAGDAHRLAREAVEQRVDIVVAVGGDGTINEIIQELAGSETALGVLPWGTVNVWAREVGIPMDNVGAQEVLVKGLTRRIDLGKVNDRYFLLMAGIGFDGEVTHAVEKKPAKRLGVLGYLLVGTWLGLGYPDFRTSLEIDGHVVKINALQIIIGNTQLYGGALKYTWQAKCDDGLLDICILRKQSMLRRFMVLLDFLLHRDQRRQWVRYEKCTTVKIRTRHPVAIQADGDPMGYTPEGNAPITFTVVPGALKVIVPEQAPGELFST